MSNPARIDPEALSLSKEIKTRCEEYEKHSVLISRALSFFTIDTYRFVSEDYRKAQELLSELQKEYTIQDLLILLLNYVELDNPDMTGLAKLVAESVLRLHCGKASVESCVKKHVRDNYWRLNTQFERETAATPGTPAKVVRRIAKVNILEAYARHELLENAAKSVGFVAPKELEKSGCLIL